MTNQRELILMHLKKFSSITPDEAKTEYGCARSRHGGKTYYARYRLAEVGQ